MKDANIVTLYKNRGERGNCNNYHGISLLSVVGKLLACVMLKRLLVLADRVYPESRCGFQANRSAGMAFLKYFPRLDVHLSSLT